MRRRRDKSNRDTDTSNLLCERPFTKAIEFVIGGDEKREEGARPLTLEEGI